MKKSFIFIALLFVISVFTFVRYINVYADDESRVQVILTQEGGSFKILGGTYDGTTNYTSSKSDFFAQNSEIVLTAEPNEGYGFVGWFVAEEENNEWNATQFLSGLTQYSFTVEAPYYNIMPLFERELTCSNGIGHNNIWTVAGGEVAVLYANGNLDGTNYGTGEIVDYCVGDEITVKARPNQGYRFVGWYITDPLASLPENYVREPVISTSAEYTYKPGVTTISGYNEPLNYITAVFEEDSTTPQANEKTYTLDDERGNQISFKDNEGIVFVFNSLDLLNLTEADVQSIMDETGMTIDEVKFLLKDTIDNVIKATKEKGTLVGLYDFSVTDGHTLKETASGGFKIRIKMTSDMKKYNTFIIGYVKDDGSLEESIPLVMNGDYLEGTLSHLSLYAVVGKNVEKTPEQVSDNPKTSDNIMTYFMMLAQ